MTWVFYNISSLAITPVGGHWKSLPAVLVLPKLTGEQTNWECKIIQISGH